MEHDDLFVKKLTYFIATQNRVAVVSLIGQIAKHTSSMVQTCQEALQQADAKWVVLNFRDVSPHLERQGLPLFATFLQSLRSKPARIVLCGLHPDLRKLLESQGLLRPEETAPNLAEALQRLADFETKTRAA